jgi:3D (Asp-Asp-Asp) domain-containing protein
MNKIKFIAVAAVLIVSCAVPAFAAQTEPDPLPKVPAPTIAKTMYLRVTAYSSSQDETDYNPFITADGTSTRDGIVATNLLPFGTKVMIPALFGDKVFSVEDRMAKREKNTMDIWMSSKGKALFFGVNYANVVVLGNTTTSPANIVMAVN